MAKWPDEDAVPNAHSPLAAFEPLDDGQLRLIERTGLGALIVRGSGPAFLATAARVLDVPLPTEPNTTQGQDACLALWLGPDEWLLRLPLAEAEAWAESLQNALAEEHAAVVDVSDRACVLRLLGAAARTVLAHGCPLNLHPRVFEPGACAQSRYLKTAILIDQIDERPTYDLQVPRTCAQYLWELLVEASREFAQGEAVSRSPEPSPCRGFLPRPPVSALHPTDSSLQP